MWWSQKQKVLSKCDGHRNNKGQCKCDGQRNKKHYLNVMVTETIWCSVYVMVTEAKTYNADVTITETMRIMQMWWSQKQQEFRLTGWLKQLRSYQYDDHQTAHILSRPRQIDGTVITMMMMMSWCLMSSDVMRHIRDKLWLNAEARFSKSLRPRKPEGSLGRIVQELCESRGGRPVITNTLSRKSSRVLCNPQSSCSVSRL